MAMSAGRYDITIEQGATFSLVISYKDSNNAVIDMTTSGRDVRMTIKDTVGGATIASTEGSGPTLSKTRAASGNNITIEMTEPTTKALDFDTAVYDLESVNNATVDRILEGKVKLSREVTT